MTQTRNNDSDLDGGGECIDIDRDDEAERWARELGVSVEELRDAVRTIGNEVEKVREFLAGGGNRVP